MGAGNALILPEKISLYGQSRAYILKPNKNHADEINPLIPGIEISARARK